MATAVMASPPATPFAVVFDWGEEFGPYQSADSQAIAVGETERASARCLRSIADGACALDNPHNVTLPIVPDDPKARYTPTKEFVEAMVETFKNGGKMPKRVVWEIILGVKSVVDAEASLVEIEVPKGVTCDIVGDTHGQFYDLHNLLSIIKPPSDDHMVIFNGDFVDRGSWSVEVVLTLFAYKWLYPERVFLNRGNHETADMNKVYGFEGECKAKHGEMTYQLFADVFTALPLATLVTASQPPKSLKSEGSQPAILHDGHKRYFVVHGGPPVSKDGVKLEEVKAIDRYGRQPGQEGLMCELLWTDPQEMPGRGPSKRGVGLGFGPDVTRRWCELNEVTAVIRSHEVRQDGYAIEHDGLCITTFSCPNYCDSTGNQAAYVKMQDDGTLSYHQFSAVPHPDMKPMAYSQGFGFMAKPGTYPYPKLCAISNNSATLSRNKAHSVPNSMFGNSARTNANAPRHEPAKGARASRRMTFAAQRKLEREKTEWQVVPQLGKREGRRRRKRMPRVRKAREVERAEGSLVSGVSSAT
ncbi:phosphoprotein phosphatase [Trichosporon asahii var. asahii CBS 8904]|uniref:Serine/threonine-protein phosphatase n=1 Tax=Trichosporon asahii var. asahii (strain CBS 8904) TaxID=1220162 RepID=K1VXA8_TRIAC|nr:phosphoprotein phosphatase [Trichosporon asahii var. asahii CBS 8904]